MTVKDARTVKSDGALKLVTKAMRVARCPRCAHEWMPRVPSVLRCPRCYMRFK